MKVKVMEFVVEAEDIRKALKKLKNRKAAGEDGLKAELYKELGRDEVGLEALRKAVGRVMEQGGEPDS